MMFSCAHCGYTSGKWAGFCPQCRSGSALRPNARGAGGAAAVSLADVLGSGRTRTTTIAEVDRVLGGGLVAGSSVVIGGEPGVGKSTLVAQLAAAVDGRVALISAEESPGQIAERVRRLGLAVDQVVLVPETQVDDAIPAALDTEPVVVVVDSLQTVSSREVDGAAGGVTQVRAAASRFVEAARSSGVPVVLISHVTKAGVLAGPKTVEHLVDVVLSLEGDPRLGLRFLRPLKNRFGATTEAGVLEMTAHGLVPVPELFSAGAADPTAAGAVTFPGADGRRVIAMEVQALTSPSAGEAPKRSAQGLSRARLDQVIAVLGRHAGVPLAGHDVYVKIAGGTRVVDPGVDLALAVALVSAMSGVPVGPVAAWGELGLTGGVERVAHSAERRAAANRLGMDVVEPADRSARLDQMLRSAGVLGVSEAIAAAG